MNEHAKWGQKVKLGTSSDSFKSVGVFSGERVTVVF